VSGTIRHSSDHPPEEAELAVAKRRAHELEVRLLHAFHHIWIGVLRREQLPSMLGMKGALLIGISSPYEY
jgi:hypothetical protein